MIERENPMGLGSKLSLRAHWKAWTAAAIAAIAVLAVGGPYVYIHFFNGDEPAALKLSAGSTPSGTASAATVSTDGTWKVATGSTTGYRVHEVLVGQSTTAVGRTSGVTGSITISGSTVNAGTFTADMTTVKSDKTQRDGQFQGRIMQTSKYPTATFALTEPIDLGTTPVAGKTYKAKATGKLTLHGTTKPVTFTVQALRSGNTIRVQGSIPVTFSDYDISSPSFGSFVKVDPKGTLEFLLDLAHA